MPGAFEGLRVWQEARTMTSEIYKTTDAFPGHEQFGLISQIRRASVSVMSNIAEGHGRFSRQDFLRFLFIARGSLWEVRSLCIVASDLGLLSEEAMKKITARWDVVGSQLGGLIHKTQLQVKAPKVAPKS